MITCLHVNHFNALVEDRAASLAHFRDLYGAQFLLDKPESEYILIAVGTVIFELFVPENFLLHARFGPNYNGLEYQVPDVGDVRDALQARGIRVVGDIDVAFYTHPADTLGLGLEFYHRNFHTEGIPNGYLEAIIPLEYWRDEHPLGCSGLKRYSVVVADIEAALRFFQDFLGATVLYEELRPKVGARVVGLDLAGTVAELVTPLEDGVMQRHHARYGDGMRSTVFAVRSLQQAQSYFADRGITLQPGDAPDTLAIRPEDNRGLLFEFSE